MGGLVVRILEAIVCQKSKVVSIWSWVSNGKFGNNNHFCPRVSENDRYIDSDYTSDSGRRGKFQCTDADFARIAQIDERTN